jgi:hypothetical protein
MADGCPKHGTKDLRDSKFSPGGKYCAAITEEWDDEKGRHKMCGYKVGPAARPSAPRPHGSPPAAPLPQGTATVNPRLQAAISAFELAVRLRGGTQTSALDACVDAAVIYHRWLEPCATGNPPTAEQLLEEKYSS